MMSTRASNTTPLWTYALVAGFVVLIHAAWWFLAEPPVVEGILADGDSYARLVRVLHLVANGDWYDISFPGSNAPFGDAFHWTRLFDLLLLGLSAVFRPWMDFDQALYWAGVFVSPLMHVALALVLAWALRPVMGVVGSAVAGALTTLQIGLMSFAAAGRADHHLLFILLIAVSLGFLCRATVPSAGAKQTAWAALPLAAALWVGPEIIIYIVLVQFVLALGWLVTGDDEWRRRNLVFAGAFTVFVTLFLAAERGVEAFGAVEYDKISVVHLTYGALTSLFWLAAKRLPGGSMGARLFAGVLGAAVVGGVIWRLFPQIAGGGFAAIDPAMLKYLQLTNEYQAVSDLPNLLAIFGAAALGGPWLLWKMAREGLGDGRWAWLLIGLSFCLFVALGVTWGRWSSYAGLFITISVAGLAVDADRFVSARFDGVARTLVLVGAVFLIIAGPVGAGVVLVGQKPDTEKTKPTCRIKDVAGQLTSSPLGDKSRIIVASPNYGPEIIYRTPHRILGSLLHRNAAGLLDTVAILGGASDAQILPVIRRRQADLILICQDGGSNVYLTLESPKDNLYRRLLANNIPSWLSEIELTGTPEKGFRLFQVHR